MTTNHELSSAREETVGLDATRFMAATNLGVDFEYRPLNPNEIRLLRPLPRSPDPLSFEIVHVPLVLQPSYVALSYTWGPRGDAGVVQLNGRRLPIRLNLRDALQQIQWSKLVEHHLWVDAICIDQHEEPAALEERGCQVQLMKQIYEQATKVLVWLGKPENEANNRLAFSTMREFEKHYRRVQKNARPYRPWWWRPQPRSEAEDAADFILNVKPATDKTVFDVPGSPTYRAWLGIVALYKSPWWTRTWIFQESTIPERYTTVFIRGVTVRPFSSKVRFLCGDQEAGWHELITTNIAASIIESTPGIDASLLLGVKKNVTKLIVFRSQRVQHVRWSFLDILQMLRHTDCFDPRDKVYAPLCLASDDVHRYLKPEYGTKNVSDVYISVVRYALAQLGHNLDFLGYTLYNEASQAMETPQGIKSVLPSWVPNFAASLEIIPIPKTLYVPAARAPRPWTFYERREVTSENEVMIVAYHPLDDIPCRAIIDGATLGVSGVQVDVIKDIIPNLEPDLETARKVGLVKGREWAAVSKHKYFTGEAYADAIRRTIVMDLVYDNQGRPSERGGKTDNAFLQKPRAELTLVEFQYQSSMRMAKTAALTLRNLGLSENLYLLMVANTAVVGDMVWALAGGQALYILRPINRETNQYRFIGECYAHGLMDGEVLRRLNAGETRIEDISLI